MQNSNSEPQRVIPPPAPFEEVTFKDWKEKIDFHFPTLSFAAEVALSIMAQILIADITNPFALVLVDVPSSGKTITLNFFAGIEGLTYSNDKFTPSSFVSGAANVSKTELDKVDLLPRLRNKMLIIRDLATVFSKKEDDLRESLGLLTRVLDGEGLVIDTGTHGRRGYEGDFLFMMLAASTPIPPKVWKIMGNIGSRLFFLKINSKEKTDYELTEQITYKSYKEKEYACKEITKNLLYTLWNKYPSGVEWDKAQDSQQAKMFISRTSKLLARLRGVINVWKDRSPDGEDYGYTRPVIEQPDRINQLLYNLARGHALASGRVQITDQDLKLIIELAIDSAPTTRADLFRALLDNDGRIKTTAVMEALNCSRPTARNEMEVLKILGLCVIDKFDNALVREDEYILRLKAEFQWLLEDYCLDIRGKRVDIPPELIAAGLFDSTNTKS
jgi:hypothetical protein